MKTISLKLASCLRQSMAWKNHLVEFSSDRSNHVTQEMIIFKKIISQGQPGADQGALDAALELGYACGGWCPKGRRFESGSIPEKYPVKETPSYGYQAGTEANLRDSDGTLVFTCGSTIGTKLTIDLAQRDGRPLYIFDLEFDPLNVDSAEVWKWGHENGVGVLNVVGPQEKGNPGTQAIVKAIMIEILKPDPDSLRFPRAVESYPDPAGKEKKYSGDYSGGRLPGQAFIGSK